MTTIEQRKKMNQNILKEQIASQ